MRALYAELRRNILLGSQGRVVLKDNTAADGSRSRLSREYREHGVSTGPYARSKAPSNAISTIFLSG